ncbi:PAAR domain-containing protein [Paracoccus tegillarcae]|uniref:PAAR domain-containing protein n=1 Tax=Paracoccus tegillarcae TaxID=1529068 RepID=A0A2K9F063_9RHOB|nr:hypothetical protein CUV01_10385 [Paracoccus tegillarcae]
MQIACVGDTHLCPAHGKNVVIEGGSSVVNGRAVARVGDKCACGCTIVDGSAIALCDGRPVARLGPVAVWCRSFDHVMCSKGDEPWAQSGRMNFARMQCGLR